MPHATNAKDGVRIFYELEGQGPPLLLLHGTPGTSRTHWGPWGYREALAPKVQTVLVDLRGHGRSDAPHEAAAYVGERLAADLVAVLDELQLQRAHVWGYSMGGLVAFYLGMYAAERVESLIIGGQGAAPIPDGAAAEWARRIESGGVEWFVQIWEEGLRPLEVELPGTVREQLESLDVPALAAMARAYSRQGVAASLPQLRMPALLYCGMHDRLADPDGMKAAAKTMPNAEFVPLPGLDHLPALVRSDTILPHVLRFLRERRSGTG